MHTGAGSWLTFAALLLLSACGGGEKDTAAAVTAGEEKVLHVFNWADYIGKSTIADFETRTGIKAIYDTYDSNEVLETKLLTGRTGYDIVFPTSTFMERQIKAGVFLRLDKSKLPNLSNMDPDIMERVAAHDPGNDHSINYMWGTTGIGYNPAMVKKALGTDRIDSWAAVFDSAVASKLAKCGITWLDAPEDVVGSARIYQGGDPNSEQPEHLAETEQLLRNVRPYVRYFHSSQQVNDLATGEICVSLSWNGLIIQARSRGAMAETPVEIVYAIPDEGAYLWFDMVAIPADAPHPGNAHAFLNFLMEAEVIAAISNDIGYANGNAASLQFLEEALRNDPAVYPPDEIRAGLYRTVAFSPEYSRELNRAWTRIKTGQ